MNDVSISDFVVLEDTERKEITFAVESKLLKDVRDEISNMSLYLNNKFITKGILMLINEETDSEITFFNVPKETLQKIVEYNKLFIVGVKGKEQIEYYLEIK